MQQNPLCYYSFATIALVANTSCSCPICGMDCWAQEGVWSTVKPQCGGWKSNTPNLFQNLCADGCSCLIPPPPISTVNLERCSCHTDQAAAIVMSK